MASKNSMPAPRFVASSSTSFSGNRNRVFKRPSPLSKLRNAHSSLVTQTASTYLAVPNLVPQTSNDKRLRLKIAHRQKRSVGSPDSPRIGVEDLQKYADAYGIPLPSVCEEALHDTFSIQVSPVLRPSLLSKTKITITEAE